MTGHVLPMVAARALNQPLMVEPARGAALLSAIGSRVGLPQAALPDDNTTYEGDTGMTIVGPVAVIHVHGTLLYRRGAMEAMCGDPMPTYAEIGTHLDRALADPLVKAIVLDVDSPGGEVPGCFELADRIYAARSIKPITAIVGWSCCSAAYALASATSRITAPVSSLIGSVGVVMYHYDYSVQMAQAGVKPTAIIKGARKADMAPEFPLSAEAVAAADRWLEVTYQQFIAAVVRGRGLSDQVVRATEAAVYVAPDALTAGLIDQVAPAEQALAEILTSIN